MVNTELDVVPELDIPRLRKVVEWAEADAQLPYSQRQHNQGTWLWTPKIYELTERYVYEPVVVQDVRFGCGTVGCLCGKLAIDEGAVVTFSNTRGLEFDGMHPRTYGMKVLGLTDEQASRLFRGSNSTAMIRQIAEEIAGEPL